MNQTKSNAAEFLIPSATTRAVDLKDTESLYELILVQPASLFPVKYGFNRIDKTAQSYPPIEVMEKTDRGKMALAFKFYQMLQTYPTSNLSKAFYNAALQVLSKAMSIKAIHQQFSMFFQQYPPYQSLDIAAYTAVMSYIDQYVRVWVNNHDRYTYYLYTYDASADPATWTTPRALGKLNLAKITAPLIADPNDGLSGYHITFIDCYHRVTPLRFDRGQLLPENDNATITLCLQGSFIAQQQLSNCPEDNHLIPIFWGRVDDKPVLGVTKKQGAAANETQWECLWYPFIFKAFFEVLITRIALFFSGIPLIIAVSSFWKSIEQLNHKNDPNPPSQEAIEKARSCAKGIIQAEGADFQAIQKRFNHLMGPVFTLPPSHTIADAIDTAKKSVSDFSKFKEAILIDQMIIGMSNPIKEFETYITSEELQTIKKNLVAIQLQLRKKIKQLYTGESDKDFNEFLKTILEDIIFPSKKIIQEYYEALANVLTDHSRKIIDQSEEQFEIYLIKKEHYDKESVDINKGEVTDPDTVILPPLS